MKISFIILIMVLPFACRKLWVTSLFCFYSDNYIFPLPEDHPFPIQKYKEVKEHLLNSNTIDAVHDPGLVDIDNLKLIHDNSYINAILKGTLTKEQVRRLGFPWSDSLVKRSRSAVAGTIEAAKKAIEYGIGVNLAGGTHHSFPDHGSGYCVFNDVAIAIKLLCSSNKVMIVDVDAHQGNGTHSIFSSEPNVFTYSIHVGANFPRNKYSGSCDVELPRWVEGKAYLGALKETLPRAIKEFKPDIVFYLAGVDVHEDDRFGQMKLSTTHVLERDSWILNTLNRLDSKLIIVLGGGYNKDKKVTAILHSQTIKLASQIYK